MRYLIALFVLSGCTDFSKLSAENRDLAVGKDGGNIDGSRPRVVDLAGIDFAGRDLASVDFDLPPEHDGSVAADMSKPDDMAKPDDLAKASDMAAPCISSLANIGTADFVIRFRITTTAEVASDVAYQRSDCNIPTSDYWEMTMVAVTGALNLSCGNGNPLPAGASNQSSLTTTIGINDGNPHNVTFTRIGGSLSATIDGASASAATAASVSFRTLPPIGVATGDPCNGSGPVNLVGTITNLCLQTF